MKPWTEAEYRRVVALRERKVMWREIAVMLGREVQSCVDIYRHTERYRAARKWAILSPRRQRPAIAGRRCLRCAGEFWQPKQFFDRQTDFRLCERCRGYADGAAPGIAGSSVGCARSFFA